MPGGYAGAIWDGGPSTGGEITGFLFVVIFIIGLAIAIFFLAMMGISWLSKTKERFKKWAEEPNNLLGDYIVIGIVLGFFGLIIYASTLN
ncbi:hypothetical protein [Spiribacter roseus]|uniref:DUF350 domain-containing protein n=1 Tax=Spiribacter roseus TaxID=1855875 RepID=A0ABV3RVI3_9GAMM